MLMNQYVGVIAKDTDFNTFVNAIKEDARKAKLLADGMKIKVKEDVLLVTCTGDIANLIRKRKEVVRFRCDKIANSTQEK